MQRREPHINVRTGGSALGIVELDERIITKFVDRIVGRDEHAGAERQHPAKPHRHV